MRFYYILVVPIIVVFALSVRRTPPQSTGIHHPITPHLNAKATEGGEGNPDARDRDEWMRLRDPATGKIPPLARARELAFASTLPARNEFDGFAKNLIGNTGAAAPWQARGPVNIGGRTRALAVDFANENVILAGGVSGGMWRSTNAGTSWTRVTPVTQNPCVTCIVQDTNPGKTNTWYIGTGEFRTNVQRWGDANYYGDGIYKSTDDGLTWQQISTTATSVISGFNSVFQYVNNIAIVPNNGSSDTAETVYAAVYGAIMRTTNNGDSWDTVLGSSMNTVGYTNVTISSNGNVYAAMGSGGTMHGIWRSQDGTTWTDITPVGLWADSTRGVSLNVAPANPNILYVIAETPSTGGTTGVGLQLQSSYVAYEWYSLWKYDYVNGVNPDAPGLWINKSSSLPDNASNYPSYNGLASYAMYVRVSPQDTNTVFLGGTCLYESSDGFSTPKNIISLGGYYMVNGQITYSTSDTTSLHPDMHALMFSPHNTGRIYTGSDGGVRELNNFYPSDTSWIDLNKGYITGQFYSVALDRQTKGNPFIIGGLQDNGSFASDSLNPLELWTGDWSGGDGCMSAVGDSGKSFFVSSEEGYVLGYFDTTGYYISPSGGNNSYVDNLFMSLYAVDPNNSNYMYLSGNNRVWINTVVKTESLNNGSAYQDWSEMENSNPDDGSYITALSVSTANPQHRLYSGTSSGRVFAVDNANQGNALPYELTGDNFPLGAWVNCIAVDPENADNIMVVFSNYNVQSLFYSSDEGNNWTAVGGNLEENPDGTGSGPSCRWVSILHRMGDTVYFVGTSVGLFSTNALNGAATVWTQEGAGTIGNTMISMTDIRQSDRYVAIATWGNGMFSTFYPDKSTGVNETPLQPNQDMVLTQNYPNPFGGAQSATTTISFTLSSETGVESSVSLDLYDETGRSVRSIFKGSLPPGEHSVTLNSDGLPAGIYYYRLQTGGNNTTRSMRILR